LLLILLAEMIVLCNVCCFIYRVD